MLVGAIILQVLSLQKKISVKPGLFNTARSAVAQWTPAVLFHVMSIYCGSVALSQLPVPVFVCLHSLISVVENLYEGIRKFHSWRNCQNVLSQLLVVCTISMVYHTDPEGRGNGYLWMLLHILSVCGYVFFEKLEGHAIKLEPIDKLYCNYVFSFVLLAPFTYFLGDVFAAQNFEFFTFYRFYAGCVLSGVCGCVWCLLGLWLREAPGMTITIGQCVALSKLLVVLASLFLHELTFQASHAFWLLTNLLLLIICEVPFREVEISEEEQHET